MDIREFLDELYSLWAKTTGAEDRYWMPRTEHGFQGVGMLFGIRAVGTEQDEIVVADTSGFDNEADVDFITAIHGALPDLVRRTHEALDEADRLDEQRDDQEFRIAQLEADSDAMKALIEELTQKNEKLLDDLIGAQGRIGALVKRKNDLKQETAELGREVVVLEDQVAQLNWQLSKERGE